MFSWRFMSSSLLYLIFTLPSHSPVMKGKKTVANNFQWMPLVTWRKIWLWFFFLIFRGSLSLKHKYKDRNTRFLFALGNGRTRVTCKSCEARIFTATKWQWTSIPRTPVNSKTRQRKAWHPHAGGQSWFWPLTPWPTINRVPPLIMNNLHAKFESDQAKIVVSIMPIRCYRERAKVDLDLWFRDPK